MWWKNLSIVIVSAWTLTGCASSAMPSPGVPETLPANLRAPCPDLAAPADGTSASVLRWAVQTVEDYRECASRHRRLVEAWPR